MSDTLINLGLIVMVVYAIGAIFFLPTFHIRK